MVRTSVLCTAQGTEHTDTYARKAATATMRSSLLLLTAVASVPHGVGATSTYMIQNGQCELSRDTPARRADLVALAFWD